MQGVSALPNKFVVQRSALTLEERPQPSGNEKVVVTRGLEREGQTRVTVLSPLAS